MCRRVRAVFCGIAAMMMVGACTLTTDLNGYAGPPVVLALQDAGDVVIRPDDDAAPVEASASDAYRALVLSDFPVGYWRLGDTGSVAKDEVGGHDGTYMGSVQHVDGVAGSGATSFGSGSYVKVSDVFGFIGTAPFTLEAWTAPTAGDGSSPACLIAKDIPNSGGSVQDGWAFYLGNDDSVIASRWSSGTQEYASGPVLTATGAFSHVVMTYDGKAIVVFINGELVGDLLSKITINAVTSSLTIGASRDGTSCFFHGVLGEVAIYDKALTNDRIAAHYAAVIP